MILRTRGRARRVRPAVAIFARDLQWKMSVGDERVLIGLRVMSTHRVVRICTACIRH